MKIALIAAVCLVLVAIIAAESEKPTRNPRRLCHKQEDCDPDRCCVGSKLRTGICRKRGGEGDRCNSGQLNLQGTYILRCPCAEGLSCVPEEKKQTDFGEVKVNERCVADSNTFSRT